MWTIIKYKKNECETLMNNLKKIIGKETLFYIPKIVYEKKTKKKVRKISKPILGNYLFCYNKKFCDKKFLYKLRYTKGLEYFLQNYFQGQSNILKFINFCKKFENKDGGLMQSFFNIIENNKAKFINGPLSNIIFEIFEKKKKIIKGSLGSMTVVIKRDTNLLYN